MSSKKELSWPRVTRENRPWTRWWWPGSAVDHKNLKRSFQELHDAGIGGVELTPIYGIPGYEERFIKYLSPDWMEMFAFTVKEAGSQDMGVDMPTGTGWPFGGPCVSPEDSDSKLEVKAGKLTCKPSGFKVKRPAPGAEGPALNPYSPDAMRRYLKRFDKAFASSGAPQPRTHFHDSFEYHANWCQNLCSEFRKRCGYELEDYAEELLGKGDTETAARVRADYRRTLAELHLRYIQTWTEWTHRHKSLSRNQAHGAPGNLLDLYAAADIPETETFGSNPFPIPGLRRDPKLIRGDVPNPQVAMFASSAGHTQGKNLVSCESCTWLREHFNTSLAQMKPEIDQMFLSGINHILYHGTCYCPDDTQWPGWLFYASVQMNPRNSIWRDVPELNKYLTRCQSILQSGKPDNDLLLYWPFEDLIHEPGKEIRRQFTVHCHEWLTESRFGELALLLNQRGYACDYISDRQTGELSVAGGLLRAIGGTYKAILVPQCKHMSPQTLGKLLALAEAGATIIFDRSLPADVPGLAKLEQRRKQLEKMKATICFSGNIKKGKCQAQLGKGRIIIGKDTESLLKEAGISREPIADEGLRFIRRSHDEGKHYFVASLAEKGFDGWTPLSCEFRSAVIMDPLSGKTDAATLRKTGSESQIRLQLKPGQTLVIRTFNEKKISGKCWPILAPKGKAKILTGKWDVKFIEGGPEIPPPFSTRKLASWTKLGGKGAESFGGTARYRLEFDLQPKTNADDWLLDLGDVRESAKVFLNGKLAGTAWSIPFELKVGEFLKAGKNILEIEVTNLCANRVREMDILGIPWKKFGDINMVTVNYTPLDASIWPILESGLLGQARLIPLLKII